MITIKKNIKIDLDVPIFTCDGNAVGSHLETHDMLKMLNVYGFLCIIGKPGSGKTSLGISFLTQKKPKIFKKTHHHLYLVMPTNSLNSLKNNPFKVLPKENIYNELTNDTILDIAERIDANSKNGEKTILFMDDVTADLKSSRLITDTMKKLIFNRRHLKLNIIICAQVYNNMVLDIRKIITNLILFKPSKKEFENVFEELMENKKEIMLDIMKLAYNDDPHNYLFINVPSQRMFINSDEIIINEDEI